ncbi:MAG: hypothetical protein MZV70_41485 [Desulfobacterales bacterium]|nr:hypothetical protein [Desulfobacterales bacterium]
MNQDMIAQMIGRNRGRAPAGLQGRLGQGPGPAVNNGLDVAQAKYFAGEVVTKCATLRHAHPGGLRLLDRSTPWRAIFRDAPTYTMVEGSANICKFIMAQDQLGIRKANR